MEYFRISAEINSGQPFKMDKTITKKDVKELKIEVTKFLKYVKYQVKASAYRIDIFSKM